MKKFPMKKIYCQKIYKILQKLVKKGSFFWISFWPEKLFYKFLDRVSYTFFDQKHHIDRRKSISKLGSGSVKNKKFGQK